jgi:preprotein translocase subunit YajC
MNIYAINFLQAQGGQGGGWTMLLMLALIFVVMWLFMIRPQQKRQKELNNFRDSLKKGDKVVTVGGIYGTVLDVNDNKVMLEIDKDVKIKVDKASLVKDFSEAQQ